MEVHVIEALIGQTAKVFEIDKTNDTVTITLENGDIVHFYHSQDCCESVTINDVVGDVNDMIGHPFTLAEEVVSNEHPVPDGEYEDSYTWTFYKFATVKGYLDIKWFGSSNGYYSESVDISVNGN